MRDEFDPESFVADNVVDSCSVSNLLSSPTLFQSAFSSRFTGCITATVEYECLGKPHAAKREHAEIQTRLRSLLASRQIVSHPISLEDLQEEEVLAARKRMGRGELSCIVFAKKVGISVMTDDLKAASFARSILGGGNRAQGTPRLLGWLLYMRHLADAAVTVIAKEHTAMGRPLGEAYENMQTWIGHCRQLTGK